MHPDAQHMAAILLEHVARRGPLSVFEAHYSHGASLVLGRHHRQAMKLLVQTGYVRQVRVRVNDRAASGYALVPGTDIESVVLLLNPPEVESDDGSQSKTHTVCVRCGELKSNHTMTFTTNSDGIRHRSDLCGQCARSRLGRVHKTPTPSAA